MRGRVKREEAESSRWNSLAKVRLRAHFKVIPKNYWKSSAFSRAPPQRPSAPRPSASRCLLSCSRLSLEILRRFLATCFPSVTNVEARRKETDRTDGRTSGLTEWRAEGWQALLASTSGVMNGILMDAALFTIRVSPINYQRGWRRRLTRR